MNLKSIYANKFLHAFLAGSLCSLAFAPFHFFIFSIISLSLFYFLLEKNFKNKKEIFFLGLSFGYGYFLFGIYWIAISLLVDAANFAWLIPFCLTFIPLTLATYFGLFALSYKKIIEKFKFNFTYQKILVFSLIWLVFEILRSILLSGFPWNLQGYTMLTSLEMSQIASIFSVYGLSFFVCIISLIPALLINKKTADRIFLTILIILITANFIYGKNRLNTELNSDKNTKLRLVQANIKQDMKWDPREKYENFIKHIAMSNANQNSDIKAIIWSETSIPYILVNSDIELISHLRKAINPEQILISGALRPSFKDGEIDQVFNSTFTIDKNGVLDFYDKNHLVPFGEYVPFQKYIPFVEKITGGAGAFGEGPGPKTLNTKYFSFSPLICYEVIFANKIINHDKRPDLLVNTTNDAWFGNSSGPYQHLDAAIMRSIEYGISMARVANTGITAYIDPLGRIKNKINLNEENFIDVDFISAIDETIFSKYSFKPLSLLILSLILILFTTKLTPQNYARIKKTKSS